jgi:hypothetical protein
VGSPCIRLGPKSYDKCPRETEDGGRGQSGAAPRQGKLRVVGSRQKPGERSGTGSPSEPPEGNKSADILGFGLLASRTVREQNLIVLISSVCGNLLQYS